MDLSRQGFGCLNLVTNFRFVVLAITNIPGTQSVSSFTLRLCSNQGDPMVGAQAHLLPSLNSENRDEVGEA